ncbi:RNA pyrophosphohydrolase [Azospirillaceae bacterium]
MIDRRALPYRPCVGIMLINRHGKVWVGRRIDAPDAWQMPQGGIDPGETPAMAALREMREEIGTGAAEIIAETDGWLRYDLPDHLLGKVWQGRYRGQEQRWIAARFLGRDLDINLATNHPEFDAWRWAEIGSLLGMVVPFKRQVYETVIQEFMPTLTRHWPHIGPCASESSDSGGKSI